LWECGVDLATFLVSTVFCKPNNHSVLRVLELGCGHGLPGIVALLSGATVHFQDYNKEVLRELTIPSVLGNRNGEIMNANGLPARFFAGDWGTLDLLLESLDLLASYDLVLTSETIYSLDSIGRLVGCIKKVSDL